MDIERIIKRALITLAVSIIIIFVAKAVLGKMFTHLGQAASVKKQQAATKQAATQREPSPPNLDTGTKAATTPSPAESEEPVAESPAAQ